MLNLKKTTALLLTIMTVGINASAAELSVKMNRITEEESTYMIFDSVQPVMENDILFVPARAFANATNMDVKWDQSTETATLAVDVQNGRETPVKKYFSELINKVSGYGLELYPQRVSVSLTANKNDAVVRFIFEDTDGDEVAIGKTVTMASTPRVINDSTIIIPLRDVCGAFNLNVGWSQEELAVEIAIPEYTVVPLGLKIIPVHASSKKETQPTSSETDSYYNEYFGAYTEAVTVSENAPVAENKGIYLGRFKITHYCPCSICNGGYGNNTAYAGKINPGTTIAVDPSVIPPLSWVYIDGYGLRRAEDCGGGINGHHIDMAVSSHSEAYDLGVVYKDVWLQ